MTSSADTTCSDWSVMLTRNLVFRQMYEPDLAVNTLTAAASSSETFRHISVCILGLSFLGLFVTSCASFSDHSVLTYRSVLYGLHHRCFGHSSRVLKGKLCLKVHLSDAEALEMETQALKPSPTVLHWDLHVVVWHFKVSWHKFFNHRQCWNRKVVMCRRHQYIDINK